MRLLLAILILLLPFGYAMYLWPDLPEQIPTHFGIEGKPDAWGGKGSIFVAPGILSGVGLVLFFIFQNLGKVDPKLAAAPQNASIFRELSIGIVVFLSILALLIIHASAKPDFSITQYILSFVGISFALFGRYMPRLQPNYFAGFRLPWTLENPDNWKHTHQLAGIIWFYGGIIQAVICSWAPAKWSLVFFMSILLVQILVPIIISYNFYRKTKN